MKMILLTFAKCFYCFWTTMSTIVANVDEVDATENQQPQSAKNPYYFRTSIFQRKEFGLRFRRSQDSSNRFTSEFDLNEWKEVYIRNISNITLRNHSEKMFELCPVAYMCERKVQIQENETLFCCIVCSCDPLCRYTNTCCPHYLEYAVNVTGTEPRKPQAPSICRFPIYFHEEIEDLQEYTFIASCPESSTQTQKELCQSEPSKGFRLEDITPLFDNATVRNYMNRHCAQCNDVNMENAFLWKPKVGCKLYNLKTTTEVSAMFDEVIDRDDCFIEFSPPVDRTKATLCETDVISTCNVTGKWSVYEDELASSCSVYPLIYVHKPGVNERRYSNIFCALCNGEYIYKEFGICTAHDVNTIYALLVSVKLPGTDADSIQDNCGADSVFDPLTEQCQTVYCTPPHMLNIRDKTCHEIAAYSFVGAVIIPARVIFNRDLPAKHAVDTIWNYLENSILNDIYLCYVKMYFNTNQTNLKSPLSFNTESLIREVMLIIYTDIDIFGDASKLYTDIVQRLRIPYTFNHWPYPDEITMNIVAHGIDPLQQIPSHDTHYLNLAVVGDDNIWVDEEQIKWLQFYEDPYSKTLVAEDVVKIKNKCMQDIIIYGLDFLPCMTFTYNINNSSLKRVPTGLMYNDRILFQFGEFISLNDSYVIICVDAVQQKFSRSAYYGYTRSLVVLLSILTTGEIYMK